MFFKYITQFDMKHLQDSMLKEQLLPNFKYWQYFKTLAKLQWCYDQCVGNIFVTKERQQNETLIFQKLNVSRSQQRLSKRYLD